VQYLEPKAHFPAFECSVTATTPSVAAPRYSRYGWAGAVTRFVYNSAGFPLETFRDLSTNRSTNSGITCSKPARQNIFRDLSAARKLKEHAIGKGIFREIPDVELKQVAAEARSLDLTSMNDLTRRKDDPHCPRRSVTIQHESLSGVLERRQMGVCPDSMNKALSPGHRGEGFRSYSRF
jgi:hypothetical protein